jgi:A/G-specific adenine glycosylase
MKFLKSIDAATQWSSAQYAGLPWRSSQRSLYTTAVSEFMLQQTVVGTVLKKFPSFIETFPSWNALAQAQESEVLKAWEGLGYYRRARLLHKLAKFVIDECPDCELPLEEESLLSCPGIGPYTANAILGIGANRPALALDTNLKRVLGRFFGLTESFLFEDIKRVWPSYLTQKKFSYRLFLEGMMDVGRVFCKERSADCHVCPMRPHCLAFKNSDPLAFGQKKSVKKESINITLIRLFVVSPKQTYFYQKSSSEWLTGQWESLVFTKRIPGNIKFEQYPEVEKSVFSKWIEQQEPIAQYSTTITKYKFKNLVFRIQEADFLKIQKKSSSPKFSRLTPFSFAMVASVHLSSATLKGIKYVPEFQKLF